MLTRNRSLLPKRLPWKVKLFFFIPYLICWELVIWSRCCYHIANKWATLGAQCCWIRSSKLPNESSFTPWWHSRFLLLDQKFGTCGLAWYEYFMFIMKFLIATSFTEIKKRMEKDVDEVGKIARNIRGKVEEINKDVLLYSSSPWYTSMFCETKQPVIMLVLFSDSFLYLFRT